ncbi:endo-1,4-beta-xylanase [Thermoactinospora rubra]|uniref:endo-1,4-beta-xylanase n=1 Tax=Thermoactinospora rubra TaxID=1088767 RepID=UPI000A11194E|nr:endo-1,4-beta-xylanase [Thermoactinospora rubra]
MRALVALLALCASLLVAPLVGAPPAAAAPTVIAAYDFEDGTTQGWAARGSGVTVAVTADAAHGGASSLAVRGRTATWHGASITPPFEKGVTYTVTGWVRALPGQPSSTVALTVERTPAGGSAVYERVAAATVTDAAWVELTGTYLYSEDSTLNLYVESSGAAVEFLVDDVVIASDSDPTQSGLVTDFESGSTQGWSPRASAALAATAGAARSGSYGLAVTGRQASWDGASRSVLGKMALGSKYELSVWVRTAQGGNLGLSIERRSGGTPTYQQVVAPKAVPAGEWVRLRATYTLAHEADFLAVYVESDTGTFDYDLDDFSLTYIPPKPIQTDIPSLKDVLPFTVGTAVNRTVTLGEHGKLVTKHYESVTPGNALKWDATEPAEGQFRFEDGDYLVDWALDRGLRFRGHTLVWHSQVPDWVFEDAEGGQADKATLLRRLENHIRAVMGRYKGKIGTWDVVNEVIDENQPDGLRRSPWFQIAGLDYIRTAFRVAREVDPQAKLVINDYNTEYPRKREALYKVVRQLLAEGVPIDAVGHQLHVNIEQAPASFIEDTIERFATLGVDQQVTELDVSVYTDFVSSYPEVPQEVLVEQGHRYKEIFDVFRRQAGRLSSVTIWGVADDETWLSNFPINRLNPPLPFDDELQAKPAYWGIVDPSRLPPPVRKLIAPEGAIRVDGRRDLEWDKLPDAPLARVGDVSAGLQARTRDGGLVLLAEVTDRTFSSGDSVTFTAGGRTKTVKRTASGVGRTPDGYRVEAEMPADSPEGSDVTVKVEDSAGGETSWTGRLTAVPAVKLAKAARGAPAIDGVVDRVWARGQEIRTATQIAGSGGATARVRALWQPGTLYVLAQVTDPELSEQSPNAWEQDSVEIFVDPENNKTKGYDDDDGQYRISFTGRQTVGGTFDAFAVRDNLTSAAKVVDGGYVIEAAIELPTVTLADGTLLGFDVQVNDATGASRTAAVTWNDPTGQSYLNTSRWGVLRLSR